jgi:hypothetical protein
VTFVGSIPQSLRSIVGEAAKHWPVGDAYVGCSGNFTIERTLLAVNPAWRLHSNDVSIYTTAIGNWLTGKPVEITVRPEWADELSWLAESLDGGVGSVAALQLFTHFGPDLRIDHPWNRRNVEAHRHGWAELFGRTVAKLQANRFPVASYHAMDVRRWLEEIVPADATVLSFPPFDVGGYEKLYERLDEVFEWPRPSYEIMGQDGVEATVQKIADRPRYLMGVLHERPELRDHLVGYVRETSSARPFYVYARDVKPMTRYVVPQMKVEPAPIKRLGPGDVLGDRLWLKPLTQGQFIGLRAKYLNAHITVSTGNLNYPHAVMVDDRMIGVIAYGMWTPTAGGNEMLLLTDFAVEPHDYPKLSKLVVMATRSKEIQRLIERGNTRRLRRLTTAVFTNNPVSMKYRGLYDFTEREEQHGGVFRYKITYKADAGTWTLAEALETWKQRWGQRAG